MTVGQSYRSSSVVGASKRGRPAVCASTWLTRTFSLPAAANAGQYVATGACRSSSPRSASISTHRAVIVLVVDHTGVSVSRSHGVVRSASVYPPQRSTTGSPSTYTATEAPTSLSSSEAANASRTAANRSVHVP